ncbi:hypothetical protein H6775_02685 [Candidatus Nomurabacteria bacterium]|nr:hypothetical protein [Candidatus Nomurabacteria bacterium]
MNNKQDKIILIISTILFALITTASIFFITFIFKQKTHLLDTLTKVKELKSENIVEIKQSLQIIQFEVEELNNFFIEPDAVVNFIGKIEEFAVTTGLTAEIQNVRLEDRNRTKRTEENGEIKSQEVRGGGELILTVQTRGSWNAIMSFLAILEKIDKKITIDGLRLSSSVDGESGSVLWGAIFNISVLTN